MKNTLLYVLIAVAVLAIGYKLAYPKMPAEDMIAKVVDVASGTVADAMSGAVDAMSGMVADVASGTANAMSGAVDAMSGMVADVASGTANAMSGAVADVAGASSFAVVSGAKLMWLGEKVGGSHPGEISISQGTALIKGGKLVGGSLMIDMSTITTTDDAGEKLDTHLKANDFFDVERYPTAEFKLISYDGTNLVGDLTMKGITKSISFPATVTITNTSAKIVATTNIERALRQIGEGNAVVSPYFKLEFDVTFNK